MELTFADVLEIYNGRNQRHVENPAGKYPIYGSGGVMGFADDFICPENTVVIGRKGNINKPIFVTMPFWNVDTAFGLVAKSGILLPKYLYYFCEWFDFEKLNTTVTIPSLTKANLLQIHIHLPSMEDQWKIVQKFEAVESLISHRQDEIHALDQLIKARFVEMFGECEELVPAGTIMSEMRNGISPSTSGKHHEKVLTLSAITQGRFDPTMWKDGAFDTEPPTEKRISAYDFYMCRGNGNKKLVGAGVYSAEDRRDLVFPDTVIAARVDTSRVCLPYLFVAWMQPDVRDQIETGARTTNGTYKINQQVISSIKIPLPNLAQQKQFATFVSQVDKSKLSIQASLTQLETLKQSLMQKYFG